ncbi:SGNH/GDSL hydrolase family protein [Marinilactibacillus kalidii]|uniref:SGNH/GDSL hydrolase family protein n=1 Tax=Marinilactibacillus kalidii TaxID=2820274 RepID=UPI001ABDBE9F|nr:SGNH/GDSL hydrolase family protein [Marinilactibacillus kalidii]
MQTIFSEYTHNISTDNFPVLTAGRRSRKTTDMEIIELGDSHGWGQGATGNEWEEGQPVYSIHNPPITSRGFYEILNEHLNNKFAMYKSMITFSGFSSAGEVTKVQVNRKKQETPNKNTDHLEVLTGRVYVVPSLALQSAEDATFYSRVARNDVSHFGYSNVRQKMARGFYAFGLEGAIPFKLSIQMKEYARKMYMGVVKTSQACKIKIYFSPENTPQTTSGEYYKNASGFPKIFRMVNGAAVECTSSEALVTGGVISIDTYSASSQDVIYCIDWGFKQKGEVLIEYNGFVPASSNFPALGSRAFHLRGIMFDRNIASNYSMGGHTTGGWLGTEASYQDAAYDHIAEILRYASFTPYLSIIQAPIVNEYLRQTPIATFKNNLAAIVNRLKNHRSNVSGRGTDVLFLSTIGSRTQEFGTDKAMIKYDAYFTALKEFCSDNKHGYIDFRQLFKDNVAQGLIDYQLLYHDSNHPSPFVHEFIGNELIKITNIIF